MWYFCENCSNLFEDGEQRDITEVLDVIDNEPYQVTYSACPVCGGAYEEADVCECCGRPCLPGDIVARLYCRECMDELETSENLKAYVAEDEDNFAEWAFEKKLHYKEGEKKA